jgi:two-component system sensor histidine kinase/response regulator
MAGMDRSLHDIRNDLAVAIASVHAFIDGKLVPDQANLHDVLESLQAADAALTGEHLRPAVPATFGNESFLNAIIDGSPYAKVLVDASGRIALVNAQTERLFGYAREELLGQSIEMLVPARFRPGHPALRGSFTEAPVARPMGAGRDLYGRRKDGSEVPIEIGLNPIVTDVETFTLAAITDITERKRSEELRLVHVSVQQHAAELEELNRELASASRFKTQFVATMSHELRTPLAAIVGAAELLGATKLDERAQITVQTISEAADTLFALINSVLDFSKIEAGKMELQIAPFKLDAVVEGAADVVAELARSKGIALHTYVDPSIPPLLGDADRLRQIVMNLLGNAVKFTDHGHVIARAISHEVHDGEIVLRFDVKDTGIGIASDVVGQLFEPFVQADGSTSRKFGGTGLGLSISRSLVELMGGEIGVSSELGSGSTFWFTARFERAADNVVRTLDGIGALIVSGDDAFAQVLADYLTSWSMESRRAGHRDDVLRALRPGETGSWVVIVDLETIGSSDLGATIDIISAIAPDRVIMVGGDRPLRKPLRQSQLFDAIVKAVMLVDASQPAPVVVEVTLVPAAETMAVLVAEDNARLQRLLKLQFDDLGVTVTFVDDGEAAVEAARNRHYALIFMDCQMPNMDGLAATRAIRADETRTGSGHVPITAMTANAFAEDRTACLAAGMDDYLSKPVRLADLRGMLDRWVER